MLESPFPFSILNSSAFLDQQKPLFRKKAFWKHRKVNNLLRGTGLWLTFSLKRSVRFPNLPEPYDLNIVLQIKLAKLDLKKEIAWANISSRSKKII